MRDGLPAECETEPAEKTEDIDSALHLAGAFDKRLAFLAGEQLGEFGFARFENLRRFVQDASARNWRGAAPTIKRALRGRDRFLRVVRSALRIARDLFA